MRKVKEGEKLAGWTIQKAGKLEDELYNIYAELLSTGKTSSDTFMGQLLLKDFKSLQTKETDDALKVIKEIGKIAQTTASYFNKKEAADVDFSKYLLRKNLMPWQQKVLDEVSKKIALLAGRRAGKSYELASEMIEHCLEGPDVYNNVTKDREAIYIGLTFEKAKAVIWDILLKTIELSRAPVRHIDNGICQITFTNGSSIRLWGNNSKAEREKLRGLDASMFVIDECQSQSGLMYLIDSIISPIVKGRNGKIMLSGTAPLSAGTYWEKALTDKNWSVFHATMADNTTIPDHENALEEVLKTNGWTRDNITFRREYLGEIAYDTNLLIYPTRTYETETNKPVTNRFKECWIGLDYGFRDATALAPILIDEKGNGWLRHEFKQEGMSATSIVETLKAKIKFIKDAYGLRDDQIYVIQDTNEKSISADMNNQGIKNIRDAKKLGEAYQMAIVRDSLESGRLNIQKDGHFDQECNRLVYKWDSENNSVIYEIDDATYHGDICDAVKYAWSSYTTYNNYMES